MILVDTGVLYALADRDDAWHARAVSFVRRTRERLIAPVTVLPEAAYLIHERLGPDAEQQFVRSIARQEIAIESLTLPDWARCQDVLASYPDIGLVDASVVALAERLRLDTVATTDRRHFGAVRPRHRDAFLLVP